MTFSSRFHEALQTVATVGQRPHFNIGQPVFCKPGISTTPYAALIVQHLHNPMLGIGEWIVECSVEGNPHERYTLPASWLTDTAPAERSAYVRRALLHVIEGGMA